MINILIDTNILLDVLTERKPYYASSAAVWTLAERGQIKGFISAISYNNIYYVLKRTQGQVVARKALVIMRDMFSTVELDQNIINMAIDSKFRDFEDAIQYFCSVRVQADYIITRNAKDFKASDIPVLSPEEFLSICSSQ